MCRQGHRRHPPVAPRPSRRRVNRRQAQDLEDKESQLVQRCKNVVIRVLLWTTDSNQSIGWAIVMPGAIWYLTLASQVDPLRGAPFLHAISSKPTPPGAQKRSVLQIPVGTNSTILRPNGIHFGSFVIYPCFLKCCELQITEHPNFIQYGDYVVSHCWNGISYNWQVRAGSSLDLPSDELFVFSHNWRRPCWWVFLKKKQSISPFQSQVPDH